ncbi:MAG: sugar ABC transporter substrate-binding protein [Pseudonocardiales bacterium]|nr:MAG: sugar ABC transporter substrate-binding protein [Pseudonocardiales bacterium]
MSVKPSITAAMVVTVTAALVAGCAPGTSNKKTKSTDTVNTDVGSKPITLQLLTSNEAKDEEQHLAEAFTKKYPNVTVKVKTDSFPNLQQNGPRLIAGANAPDLILYPTVGNAVKDGLLTDLDPYAKAYGWDKFPQSQLQGWRVAADGKQRGTGALYALGMGFGMTGVFYNKEIAASLGIAAPPSTLDEFTADMAKAKAAGKTALMTSGKDGTTDFILQGVMLELGDSNKTISDWVYNKPGASIDVPKAVEAAKILQDWAKAGYFPSDVNAIDQNVALTRFNTGKGLFFYEGNWFVTPVDKALGSKAGFFPLPPAKAGGKYAAMSEPNSYVVPAKSKNHGAAAAFLNFAVNTAEGRAVIVKNVGQPPGGPADAAPPAVKAGSVLADTLTAFGKIGADDGVVPFIANATPGIYTNTLIPQCQLLVAGKISPQALVSKLQSDYASELGR